MKLIFLLFLSILSYSIEENIFNVYGKITKTEPLTITQSSNSHCVFLDTNEFGSNTKNIEIYATAYNGAFTDFYMYYKYTNTQPTVNQNVALSSSARYDSSSGSNYYYDFYDDFTFYFKIPKSTERYLYLSIPYLTPHFGCSYKVEIGVSKEFPLWALIIIIIVSSAIIIGGIIATIFFIRKRRAKSRNSSLKDPIN